MKVTNFVVRLALLGCILFGAILLTLVIVDLDLVFRFYGNLLELGIIVNPFQTSDDAIAVRYSGIFYSALNFGLFIVFSIILLFGEGAKVSRRKAALFVLLLLLVSSFNRNAFITLAYVGGAFFLFKVGMRKNIVFPTMLFGLCFLHVHHLRTRNLSRTRALRPYPLCSTLTI